MTEDWVSQIKRGTLEYAVLLSMRIKDRYGYDLIQSLEQYPMLQARESTVYPLLRRLMKNGYLDSYWKNTGEGVPARKYYRLTKTGASYLNELEVHWAALVENISELRREN